ncbi:MAG: GNAT family N-acetyltransferase [Candidatus Amulumruptor caecigallinarius]|nr:GNAT family N-acetyltransferase [Candidatus Amulumruptor caecigallinarius]
MNSTDLKNKLRNLWIETFHDSSEYVSLVFNSYFNPDLVEYEEHNGEVVAGLIGVPYNFGNAEHHVKGLYLCGLATKPKFQSHGIMTRLIDSINQKAANMGFAFTFLIPAEKSLQSYYGNRGYVNAFYQVVDNYTFLHDFDREYESVLMEQKEKVALLKKRHYESLEISRIDRLNPASDEVRTAIKELFSKVEETQSDLQIIHSPQDVDVIIRENLIDGGAIYICSTTAGALSGVAFTKVNNASVDVIRLIALDSSSKYKILSAVKKDNPTLGIHHKVSSVEMDRKALWMRTYGSVLPESPQVNAISVAERVYSLAAHAKMYGMARILDFIEILKFQAENRHDLKYSILMKLPDASYAMELVECRNGVVTSKKLAIDELSNAQRAHAMSKHDMGEILFRRRGMDNLITEAFGLPSINGSISLMLD